MNEHLSSSGLLVGLLVVYLVAVGLLTLVLPRVLAGSSAAPSECDQAGPSN